jgi:hypothetical protein
MAAQAAIHASFSSLFADFQRQDRGSESALSPQCEPRLAWMAAVHAEHGFAMTRP